HAGARVVADDDHHHERVAKADRKARRQMLERARVIVLVPGEHGDRLVQRELARVHAGERRHQDRDLSRAGRRHGDRAIAMRGRARLEVLEIPARLKRQGVTEGVESRHELLHRETPFFLPGQKYSSEPESAAMRSRRLAMNTRYGCAPRATSASRSSGDSAARSSAERSSSVIAAAGSAANRSQYPGSDLSR